MEALKTFGVVVAGGLVGAAFLAMVIALLSQMSECEKRGGVNVRTVWGGYVCAKLEERP